MSKNTIVITNGSAPSTPPSGDDAEYCEGDILTDLWADSISGGSLTWYSNPALTTIIGNSISMSPYNNIVTCNSFTICQV